MRNRRWIVRIGSIALSLMLLAAPALAQSGGGWTITRFTTQGGGVSAGGGFTVRGSAGQAATGASSGSGFAVGGGFWRFPPAAPCYDFGGEPGVGITDIVVVAERWNGVYDPAFDLDEDGDIDVVDIMTVAAAWGDLC